MSLSDPETVIALSSGHRSRSRATRVFAVVAVVFFVAILFAFLHKGENSEWHSAYTSAARLMRDGTRIHERHGMYSYPPAMAMLSVPLADLSVRTSLAVWWAINVVATCVTVACAWQLAGGLPLAGIAKPWGRVLSIGLALGARFIVAPLEHQQFDMVIAALALSGCVALWRGKSLRAGALLGAAAAMKCTPLLFAPYLLWRRQPAACAALVVVAWGLNVFPDVVFPQSSGGSYLDDWVHTFLVDVKNEAPGVWHTDLMQNQSLAGLFNRGLRFGWPTSLVELAGSVSPRTDAWLRALTYGTALALLATSAWRYGGPWRRPTTVEDSALRPLAWSQLQLGIECSAVFALMLLLSPMSGKAHFVVLLPACFIIARDMVERPTPWRYAMLVGMLLCGPLTTKSLVGKTLGDLTLAWSLPTWFALLALVSMWRVCGRVDEQAKSGPATRLARAA